jgi:hypothetical protein
MERSDKRVKGRTEDKGNVKTEDKEKVRGIENLKAITALFICLELCIYFIFMIIDVTGIGNFTVSSYLKFIGIILCLLYTLVSFNTSKDKKDQLLLTAALIFTVTADLFLLIYDFYLAGVITFCIVQMLYMLRINRWEENRNHSITFVKKIVRNILVILAIIIILLFFPITWEVLTIASIIYFIGILGNMSDSLRIAKKSKKRKRCLFAIGLVLFVLCDINVGLFNLIQVSTVSNGWMQIIYNFAAIAMWMFYLPAQVLIALSQNNR